MKGGNKAGLLLLSGYHAASHKYWCEQLVDGLANYNWQQAALPDRHFYWRIRSNALTYAFQVPELRADYDLLLATSMVDLCNLRGLLPHLCKVPTVLYFHENQFAYPQRKPNSNLINAQLTSVYSALVADRLVFNSEYNRDSFFNGATALFRKMPDGVPADLLTDLPTRSVVIPVPIRDDLKRLDSVKKNNTLEIVWNHRWEYDKQPQVFFAAIERLLAAGYELSLHVMGQSFREVPQCFEDFQQAHGNCIATWGYQSSDVYQRTLQQADIVVSTALHDFQGLGMLEAIAAGCTPVAPDRMAYPEYVGAEYLYNPGAGESVESREAAEVESLYQKLMVVIDRAMSPVIDVQCYTTPEVLPRYNDLIKSLL